MQVIYKTAYLNTYTMHMICAKLYISYMQRFDLSFDLTFHCALRIYNYVFFKYFIVSSRRVSSQAAMISSFLCRKHLLLIILVVIYIQWTLLFISSHELFVVEILIKSHISVFTNHICCIYYSANSYSKTGDGPYFK